MKGKNNELNSNLLERSGDKYILLLQAPSPPLLQHVWRRRMGLIFRHHAESAQLTARKVGILGLISFRAEPLSLRRSWSTGMRIP